MDWLRAECCCGLALSPEASGRVGLRNGLRQQGTRALHLTVQGAESFRCDPFNQLDNTISYK